MNSKFFKAVSFLTALIFRLPGGMAHASVAKINTSEEINKPSSQPPIYLPNSICSIHIVIKHIGLRDIYPYVPKRLS